MNAWHKSLLLTAFVILAGLALIGAKAPPVAISGPVLKVVTATGHGSGVSIGNGYILTATHVVKDAAEVKVKTDSGEIIKAEILWTNAAYDIALLRVKDYAGFSSAPLSCRMASVGEVIHADGNPGPLEFVSTWGKVSGSARTLGPWRDALILNMTIVPGQSGGPVFDESGAVVAIAVGVLTVPLGFGGSFVGMGFAVPGSAVCALMARV